MFSKIDRFLDVTFFVIGGKVTTNLVESGDIGDYLQVWKVFKPAGSHQYLHSLSCHSNYCKEGIP